MLDPRREAEAALHSLENIPPPVLLGQVFAIAAEAALGVLRRCGPVQQLEAELATLQQQLAGLELGQGQARPAAEALEAAEVWVAAFQRVERLAVLSWSLGERLPTARQAVEDALRVLWGVSPAAEGGVVVVGPDRNEVLALLDLHAGARPLEQAWTWRIGRYSSAHVHWSGDSIRLATSVDSSTVL